MTEPTGKKKWSGPDFSIVQLEVPNPVQIDKVIWHTTAEAKVAYRLRHRPNTRQKVIFSLCGKTFEELTDFTTGVASVELVIDTPGAYIVGAEIVGISESRVSRKIFAKEEKEKSAAEKKLEETKLSESQAEIEAKINKLEAEKRIGHLKTQLEEKKLELEALELADKLAKAKEKASGTAKEAKCHFCGAEISKDAHHCDRCKSVQRKFKRLCPYCKKEVDEKANQCLHCNKKFPIVLGSERFAYIVCSFCKRYSEIDDWMAVRRLPFLFQTEKEDKIKAMPSGTADSAAALKLKYFSPGHVTSSEQVLRSLQASDESAWCFTDENHAKKFVAQFPCICGHTAWNFSRVAWAVDKAAPIVKKTATKAGSGLAWLIRGAIKEWTKK